MIGPWRRRSTASTGSRPRSASTSATATTWRSPRSRSTCSPTPPVTTSGSTSTSSGPRPGPFGGPDRPRLPHPVARPRAAPRRSLQVSGIAMGVNYGCNKVRFPSPVPVGSKLRLGAELLDVDGRRRRRAGHHASSPSSSRARRSRPASPRSSSATTTDARAVAAPAQRNSGITFSAKQPQRLGVGVVGAPRARSPCTPRSM